MKWKAWTVLMALALTVGGAARAGDWQPGQQGYKLPDTVAPGRIAHFLLYLPDGATPGGAPWPLLIFLHGSGERGADIERVKVHGPPKIAAAGGDLPFIVASPQLASGARWQGADVLRLTEYLLASGLPIDQKRIYLTGLSLGGMGTWQAALDDPRRFAAIVPIAGWGDPAAACRLKDMPIWAFHGARDTVVPPAGSTDMVEAVNACGGAAALTLYPDADHDSWTRAYDDPALTAWLLAQQRP